MKKLIFIFAVVFIVIVSCKQGDFLDEQGHYGTVVFDLGGAVNLRAAGENGLPDIANSKVKILIERDGQRVQVKEFGEREKKQYKGSFPVGSRVRFAVEIATKSGKWKESIEHTVVSGTNSLNIKLKKATATLEPLKFKLYENGGNAKFSLGFFETSTSLGKTVFFDKEVSGSYTSMKKIPQFCRDQKGLTYLFYNDGSSTREIQLERYTSEGGKDASFIAPSFGFQDEIVAIASDHKTGRVFVLYKEGGSPDTFIKLLKEKPNGQQAELKDITPDGFKCESVVAYNDIVAVMKKGNGYDLDLHLYKFNEKKEILSKIGDEPFNIGIENFRMRPEGGDDVYAELVDCYMSDANIYLLCRYYEETPSPCISTGGILKIPYSVQREGIKIEQVEKLIFRNSYVVKDQIVNVENEAEEFYGPLRFVGFDKDALYIADDGVLFKKDAVGAEIKKENKNRLVRFNLKEEKISIEAFNIETWMPEN